MRITFDITGAVEKMTGFDKLEGKANIDAHMSVEFGADELGMMYEAQKTMLPQILDFIKEVGNMSIEKDRQLREENTDLEKDRLQSQIESLEIQLNGEKKRHEYTRKNRDEYFNKYMKCLDRENEKIKKETEDFRKAFKQEKALNNVKKEEDEDDLY